MGAMTLAANSRSGFQNKKDCSNYDDAQHVDEAQNVVIGYEHV